MKAGVLFKQQASILRTVLRTTFWMSKKLQWSLAGVGREIGTPAETLFTKNGERVTKEFHTLCNSRRTPQETGQHGCKIECH